MKSSLTKQELKNIKAFRDQWREHLTSTQAIDPDKIREAIVNIYRTKNFRPPKMILFVDSFPGLLMIYYKLSELPKRRFTKILGPRIPLACSYRESLRPTDSSVKKNQGREESDPSLLETVYKFLQEPLQQDFGRFRNQINDSVARLEYLDTPSNFWVHLRKNLSKIANTFDIDLNREIFDQKLPETQTSHFYGKVLNICTFHGNFDADLVAPAALYLEQWNWNHSHLEKFKPKITLSKNAGPVILFDNLAMVSRRPNEVNVRDNSFHCESGPSVEWRDGSALFHLENEQFSNHVVTNPKLISTEQILNANNLKRQRILLEQLGYEHFIDKTDTCLESTDDYGCLYRIKNSSFEDFVFVRVEDGSTDRKFSLRAKPSVTSPKEAVAQSFGFDKKKDYEPWIQA